MGEPLVLHDATGEIVRVPGIGTMLATGATIPSNGGAGYGPGCLFILYQTYSGDTQVYTNSGTASSATWTALDLTEAAALAGLTATAAELNVLHSVVAGTASASKALVLGASKDVDTVKVDSQLTLASASGGSYSATIALVVATPVISIAASNGTSATATINCAAVAPAGATLTIVTTTDGTGTCTVTFGTHFKVTGTQATTLSKVSTISFLGDSTNWNEVGRATAM